MKLSLYVGETRDLERSLAAIVDAERRGLHGVWLPGHRPMMEQAFGLSWEQPVERMLEYGAILRDLVEHGQASRQRTRARTRSSSGPSQWATAGRPRSLRPWT